MKRHIGRIARQGAIFTDWYGQQSCTAGRAAIQGDNGASGEGGMQSLLNEMTVFNAIPEDMKEVIRRMDELGGPTTFNHYPVGWAHAMDMPFQWTKQIASHFGGTRNGMVISWPARIKDKGGLRTQFCSVIDIMPTLLEAVGVPAPTSINGVAQKPIEGTSLVYTFDDAKAPSKHTTQYFEMFGNQGIYHGSYLNLGYFLTGEHRSYQTQNGVFGSVTVERPSSRSFVAAKGAAAGCGAWELTAQFGYLDFFDSNTPTAPQGQFVGIQLPQATFGVNWYLADRLRIMFNYSHAAPDEANAGSSTANVFSSRLALFW